MKVIKNNLTDITEWLLSPNEAIPQSKLDELARTPSSDPDSLMINDDGEIVQLKNGEVMPDNFITGKIENSKCYVIPDKFGNVRFMMVSKKRKSCRQLKK